MGLFSFLNFGNKKGPKSIDKTHLTGFKARLNDMNMAFTRYDRLSIEHQKKIVAYAEKEGLNKSMNVDNMMFLITNCYHDLQSVSENMTLMTTLLDAGSLDDAHIANLKHMKSEVEKRLALNNGVANLIRSHILNNTGLKAEMGEYVFTMFPYYIQAITEADAYWEVLKKSPVMANL